jgi:Bacterial Ig-like domain
MPSQVEAKSYKVQISSDPNFASGFVHTSPVIDQTTYTPYTTTLPEGPLYWRVQAIDGTGNALAWSLSRAIGGATQSIEKVSPTPDPSSPSGGDTVTGTPAFAWDPLNYAAKYEIQIARHGDTTFASGNRAVDDKTTQTTYVPSINLATSGNPYVWRVRRIDVDNRSGGWSAVESFSVSTDAPGQVSPAANAYVSRSDSLFTWLPVDGAGSYRIERRVVGATSTQENRSTTGVAWAPLSNIVDGHYEWRVSAYDPGNNLMGSSPWRPFTVDGTPPTVTHKSPVATGTPKTVISVDFSERVKGVTSSTFKIFVKGNHAALPATVKATRNHRSATLDPTNKLKVGKTYTIKLLSAIKDLAGHPLKPVAWSIKIKAG